MTKMNFWRNSMKEIQLNIQNVGSCIVPEGWYLSHQVKMQRLYYIKGGKGFVRDGSGAHIPFEPGKIYIHPYNLVADYQSDPVDPIDHVYFDFLSTPPIISDEPIVYHPSLDSAAVALIKSAECLCREIQKKELPHKSKPMVASPWVSKDCAYGQVFHGLLGALLTMLSMEKSIPFSTDTVVIHALETIRHDYRSAISVSSLAAEAGFEVHHFIRRFKRVMGMTPYAYLRTYRLIKAKELIDGGMSITAASACVGYESAAALSRALKQNGYQ